MVRKKSGITLIALVISIIVLILLAAIVISTLNGENGLFTKANTTNYNQAVGELYDRTYAEISYIVIPGKVNGTDNFKFEDLYNSKGFTTYYEIRHDMIWDKIRNIELVKKEDFENNIREKFKEQGKESAKPIVNAITNEDRKISGSRRNRCYNICKYSR